MIVPYNINEPNPLYPSYYNEQRQGGYGVFQGAPIQMGFGIGNVIKGLFKSTLPLIKSGAKAVGKELLRTGATVASEALQGRNIRESAIDNFKDAGSNLLGSLASSLNNPKSSPIKRLKASPKRNAKRRKPKDFFKNVKTI